MAYRIRLADKKDIIGILNVYRTYIINTLITFEYEVPTIEEFTERFVKITNHFPWLVCEEQGKVVGYAYADLPFERAAYQWNADIAVYIEENHQRKGIATRFYKILEHILYRQGYYKIYACITGTNDSSILLHKALGYQEMTVFRNSGYKLGQWLDVIWFEKNIRESLGAPQSPLSINRIAEKEISEIIKKSHK